jgi:hypothetical protein
MARQFRFLSLTLALGVLPLPGCMAPWGARVAPPPVSGVPDRPPEGNLTAQGPSPFHGAGEGGLRDEGTGANVDRTVYSGSTDPRSRPRPDVPEAPPPQAGPPELTPVPAGQTRAAPDDPLVVALRFYLDKRPDEAVEILKRYDAKNQEMLLRLLPLMVRFTEDSLAKAPPQELATLTEEVEKVAEPLRALAPLEITKMVFCQQVEGFGNYKPLEGTPTFRAAGPGQPGERVRVYAEVRNFKSELRDGMYVTKLASSAQVIDLEKRVVWSCDFAGQDDVSRTPRQDYFINYRFDIPPCLSPGQYVLSIQVHDALDGSKRAAATKSYDFRVK